MCVDRVAACPGLLAILGCVSKEERQGVNWVQVIAAALAAMSSAVLLSTLGVAGTIVGAAVGSLTASVAGALYGRGLDASRDQVAARAAALRRVAQARQEVDQAVAAMHRGEVGSQTTLLRADEALDEAEHALQDADGQGAGHHENGEPEPDESADPQADRSIAQSLDGQTALEDETARRLPWKRIALVTVGVFFVAMAAITAFEVITGRAVSTYTGGTDSEKVTTTVPGLGGIRQEPTEEPEEVPQEVPSVLPSEDLTAEPSTEPEESPTIEPTEPTEPSSAPTTEMPTASPTIIPAPSPESTG